MTPVQTVMLPCRWAVRSKPAGHLDDYEVTESSIPAGSGRAAVDGMIQSLITTNFPHHDTPGAEALPWAAFGPVTVGVPAAGGTALGLTPVGGAVRSAAALARWTEPLITDVHGREIAQVDYFDFDPVQLARVGPSYATLHGALTGLRPNPWPAEVPVAPADLPGIARTLAAEAGFTWALGVAATLLERPVGVLNGPRELTGRLSWLDAVVSLLPHGFRSVLTASTWASAASSRQPRLSFSDGKPAWGVPIQWSGQTSFPFGSIGARYADLVRQLRDEYGVEQVVTRLWADLTPQGFDHPAGALSCLAQISPGLVLRERTQHGDATLADFERLLAAESTMDPDTWAVLLPVVLATGSERTLRLLDAHWDTTGFEKSVAVAATDLDRISPLFDLAERNGGGGRFLADLTERVCQGGSAEAERRLAEFLAARPSPHRGDWRSLRNLLADSRTTFAVRVLAAVEQNAQVEVSRWLDWLCDDRPVPEPLRPLQVALRGTEQLDPTGSETLAGLPPDWLVWIITAAARRGFLHLILRPFWPRLISLTDADADVRTQVLAACARLDPARADDWADLDLFCTHHGEAPRFCTRPVRPEQRAAYARQVRDRLDTSMGVDVMVERLVTEALKERTPGGDEPVLAVVNALADAVVGTSAEGLVRTAVWTALAGPGHLTGEPLALPPGPGAEHGDGGDPDRPPAGSGAEDDLVERARAWCRQVYRGWSAAEAARSLGDWPHVEQPAQVMDLLLEFRDQLDQQDLQAGRRSVAEEQFFQALDAVLSGVWGSRAAENLDGYLRILAPAEARFWAAVSDRLEPPAPDRPRPSRRIGGRRADRR